MRGLKPELAKLTDSIVRMSTETHAPDPAIIIVDDEYEYEYERLTHTDRGEGGLCGGGLIPDDSLSRHESKSQESLSTTLLADARPSARARGRPSVSHGYTTCCRACHTAQAYERECLREGGRGGQGEGLSTAAPTSLSTSLRRPTLEELAAARHSRTLAAPDTQGHSPRLTLKDTRRA
jgi:hypothetical protein